MLCSISLTLGWQWEGWCQVCDDCTSRSFSVYKVSVSVLATAIPGPLAVVLLSHVCTVFIVTLLKLWGYGMWAVVKARLNWSTCLSWNQLYRWSLLTGKEQSTLLYSCARPATCLAQSSTLSEHSQTTMSILVSCSTVLCRCVVQRRKG